MGLNEMRFATMEDIKSNATTELRKIPEEAFRRSFQQWQDRWNKYVCVCVCVCVCARARAQGSYFEGDKVSVVICPTISVLYHNSGKFLTSSLIWFTVSHLQTQWFLCISPGLILKKLYRLSRQCIYYVFCIDINTNSDYLHIQYRLFGFITDKQCVYCAVRAESSYKFLAFKGSIRINFLIIIIIFINCNWVVTRWQ